MHIPVLLNEVLRYLDPKPNQNFIDATVGDGGHAAAILEKTSPNGKLLAIDRDSDSIIRARNKLEAFGNRVLFINNSFSNLEKIVRENAFNLANGIVFDFGMSSSQLENSGRGFSFRKDEILDMRYSEKTSITAEDILNDYSEDELSKIFKKWGEELRASQIALAIVEARKKNRVKTTRELTRIIESVKRRTGKINPSTLVFQALRIEVNQELAEIEKALEIVPQIIYSGGHATFISFHSLEDHLIKNWSKNLDKLGIIEILNKKPITAAKEELKNNPRSRSAKLRVVKKI